MEPGFEGKAIRLLGIACAGHAADLPPWLGLVECLDLLGSCQARNGYAAVALWNYSMTPIPKKPDLKPFRLPQQPYTAYRRIRSFFKEYVTRPLMCIGKRRHG